MSYKMMKVFDCQWDPGMTHEVRKAFFANCENVGNDVFVEWEVRSEEGVMEDDTYSINYRMVDDWLVENRAESGETVLIKHWW